MYLGAFSEITNIATKSWKPPLEQELMDIPYRSVLLLDGLELLGTYKWKDFDVNEFVKDKNLLDRE
jgi:hypothetical protein